MRIGLYGGSFDPIHNGHLSIVRGALKSGAVDLVIVIPTARNPFKRGKNLSPAPYRFYMTKEAVEGEKKVIVSDCEFFMDGISYTVNTLRYLTAKATMTDFLKEEGISDKKAAEAHDFFWLCGSDILTSFDKWYKADEIISMVSLLVASRPGETIDIDSERIRLGKAFGHEIPVLKFDIDGVEVSSSDLKRRKKFVDIPQEAKDFIKEHALYSYSDVWETVSDDAANKVLDFAIELYPILKKKRLLHTINTGLLSAHLALNNNADVDKALIAGVLHDCAKELSEEEQRDMAARRSGDTFTDFKLLHSPAGATMAKEKFGIEDEEILNAITYHTTGRGGMTTIDKIIYLADKIEPARTYTDLSLMRKTAETDLDSAVRMCLKSVMGKFDKQGRKHHPLTNDFARDMGLV